MPHFPATFTLETSRYRLRQPNASDIPHIFSATRFPGFNDGMQWDPPRDISEMTAPLERSLIRWEKGESYTFTIVGKTDDTLLGRIEIRQTDQENVWNVGFWTHPTIQNQGLMSEALRAILQFGFQTLRATRIEAAYATWNLASEKVLHKNGFQFVRHLPRGFQKKGEWVAENEVAIDAPDSAS